MFYNYDFACIYLVVITVDVLDDVILYDYVKYPKDCFYQIFHVIISLFNDFKWC